MSAEERASETRLRIDLAYDGTDFSGWAAQPGLRTVQGEIEGALAHLLRDESPRLTVAGRTDAGVHARGQVAHVNLSSPALARLSGRAPESDRPRLWTRKLNGVIRRTAADIAIHAVVPAPDGFDARFSAIRRRYEYRVRGRDQRRDPLSARYTAEIDAELDLDLMQHAADELLGLNDFTTFCKAREGATAVRDLLAFEWRETEDEAYAATIEADAFCHSMVRALVGAVTAVGGGRITLAQLKQLRDARERTSRFPVMPAHGLTLEGVVYPDPAELGRRAEQTRAKRMAPETSAVARDGI